MVSLQAADRLTQCGHTLQNAPKSDCLSACLVFIHFLTLALLVW